MLFDDAGNSVLKGFIVVLSFIFFCAISRYALAQNDAFQLYIPNYEYYNHIYEATNYNWYPAITFEMICRPSYYYDYSYYNNNFFLANYYFNTLNPWSPTLKCQKKCYYVPSYKNSWLYSLYTPYWINYLTISSLSSRPKSPKLASLSITPSSFHLTGAQSTQNLTVLGTYSDNSIKDLTLGSTGTVYSTSDTETATVSIDGVVMAVADGTISITATNKGMSATAYGQIIICLDADGDDVTTCDGDCDDTNPAVHPGAAEICGDGIDQDCDGSDLLCCTDADNDGFFSEGGACGPVDCDDTNANINPAAKEICEDGMDQDCDGEDLPCVLEDADGDLWSVAQGDLDDANPDIFPGATDFPNNGIDEDCDG